MIGAAKYEEFALITERTFRRGAADRNTVLGVGAVIVLIAAGFYMYSSFKSAPEETPETKVAATTMVPMKCAQCGAQWEVTSAEWEKMHAANAKSLEKIKCDKCGKAGVWRQTAFSRGGGPSIAEPAPAPKANTAAPATDTKKPVKARTGAQRIKPGG